MRRILVIDDNRSILDMLCLFLSERGYDVKVAGGGEEAISLLASAESFDLVMTDILMPFVDGNEVARHIRGSFGPDVTIVAMTGYSEEVELDLFDYSIEKPFRLEAIDRIIESLR